MSQCADAIQKLLERKIENIMNHRQLRVLAQRLADDINLTQMRNQEAREAATRTRLREYRKLGIDCARMPLCDWPDVSL